MHKASGNMEALRSCCGKIKTASLEKQQDSSRGEDFLFENPSPFLPIL